MATQVQFRRGTTADISTFIGADGEVVVDTTKKVCVIHDGVQVAGYPLLREDGSNSALSVGSLSNCALKFVNDPNTGIISPGADQVALVTGGSSRLSIDSAGSVTIPGNLLVSGSITGSITFDNGSAGLPAVRFTNDPDTGIYLAGTNQLAISTGGSGRLFVDASGNVRITSGSAWATADGNLQLSFSTNEAYATTYYDNHSITFGAGTSYKNKIRVSATGADNAITFHVGATSPNERMRITGAGLVGIGTSSPDVDLHVSNAATARIRLENRDTTGSVAQSVGVIEFEGNDGGTGAAGVRANINAVYEGVDGATALAFGTAADGVSVSEKVRIDRNGRVGIGTSSPSRLLHVAGSAVFDDGTVQATIWPQVTTNIAGFGTNNNYPVALVTNGSQRLHVTATGNVGIGTSSPVVDLDVAPAASTATFRIHARSNTTPVAAIELVRGTNTTFGADGNGDYRIKNDTGNLSFEYGDTGITTERARIDSSGRLLVGTSSSTTTGDGQYALLQIRANTAASTGGGIISLQRGESATSITTDEPIGSIVFADNTGNEFGRIAAFADANAGTNDYPGRLVFSTTANGASSPTERLRIPNGGGLSVGTTVSPSAVNQQTAIRIGALNVSQTTISNLTTTWTDITAAAGANGLAFVDIYDTSAGTQGNFLVSWRGYPANATVISSNNGTGLTINFQVASGKLQMQTTSGTVSGSAYVWAG